MDLAVSYILQNQAPDGYWSDFVTLAGESTHWVTAYCATALNSKAAAAVRRASDALLSVQKADGGWGYNTIVPSDADSTAYALLALKNLQSIASSKTAEDCLATFQAEDGGFFTYHPDLIREYLKLPRTYSLSGWCSPTVEVTCAAARSLVGCKRHAEKVQAAWEFVKNAQDRDGGWPVYWWTTRLFSTYQAVTFAKSLSDVQDVNRVIGAAATYVQKEQNSDGGWGLAKGLPSSAFSTALAILILKRSISGQEALRRGLNVLQIMQRRDGSWDSVPILRIPAPDCTDPDTHQTWHVDRLGTMVILRDPKRLFTTSTCFAALTD